MKHYITIDGGTTNTRVTLTEGARILQTRRLAIGSGGQATRRALCDALREAVGELAAGREICCVIASGMITSEYGLMALPHLPAPAGIRELHNALYHTRFPEIAPFPFALVRGVKTESDMMRGEETEIMGLSMAPDTLVVLPGSHSKLIALDEQGRIGRIQTMMTGEMVTALSAHTVLRDAVELTAPLEETALCEGYRAARQEGLNAALFAVRVMKVRECASAAARYSFFLGAILSAEVDAILKAPEDRILLGGRQQLRAATEILLTAYGKKQVLLISEEEASTAPARGAIRIYESV